MIMNELWQAQQALLREAWEYKLKMLEAMDNPPEKEKYRNLLKSKQFEAALLYPEMNEETLGRAMCLVDSNFCWELFVKICEKYELSPKDLTMHLLRCQRCNQPLPYLPGNHIPRRLQWNLPPPVPEA